MFNALLMDIRILLVTPDVDFVGRHAAEAVPDQGLLNNKTESFPG